MIRKQKLMFSAEEVDQAIEWTKEFGFYEALKNYKLDYLSHCMRKIYCLDEFELYPIPGDADETITDLVINKNLYFKFGLEGQMRTGSCYGLSNLIYQIIVEIQKAAIV